MLFQTIRSTRLSWCVPLLVACGSGAPDRPAALPSPSTTSSASAMASATQAPSSPPPVASVAPRAGGFDWKGQDPSFGKSFYHGPVEVDTVVGMCRFVYEKDAARTRVECFDRDDHRRLWSIEEGGAFVEDAAVVADTNQLYVARYSNISSGCVVTAYALRSGEEAFRTPLVGLGPIAHSEYLNAVEMTIEPAGKLTVLGWESSGRYIEVVDASTGATVSLRRLDPPTGPADVPLPVKPIATEPPHPGEAARAKFQFGKSRPGIGSNRESTTKLPNGTTCVYEVNDKENRASFACLDTTSKRLWGFDLKNQLESAAAVAGDDKAIYIVSYCAISDRATATAYDSQTGRERWRVRLHALGPIDHSKYWNVIGTRLDHGHLVISGWEASGKYVEVLDTRTGEDLGNRTEP